MALEVRRGPVSQLRSVARPRGRGARVSIAQFKLNGFPAEYEIGGLDWGMAPEPAPFWNDESIIAVGEILPGGLFQVVSAYIPRLQKITSREPSFYIGGGLLLSCSALPLPIVVSGHMLEKVGLVSLSLAAIIILFGFLIMLSGLKIIAARRLLRDISSN
ncbi:hypothetical protein H7F51_18010 [Novosphingobium flavum]|uniref:Uncharacterized protein n=1 Tax=Novosphingobium flavum TaxID=1778672 RepID=A0A7X1FW09_9SPHN|nr:hypothetical protein [Novosphingobium flavum]MBC2667417.1 hypothetical protein [Novosphingobium flavum]